MSLRLLLKDPLVDADDLDDDDRQANFQRLPKQNERTRYQSLSLMSGIVGVADASSSQTMTGFKILHVRCGLLQPDGDRIRHSGCCADVFQCRVASCCQLAASVVAPKVFSMNTYRRSHLRSESVLVRACEHSNLRRISMVRLSDSERLTRQSEGLTSLPTV